jgi:hypothetical protein
MITTIVLLVALIMCGGESPMPFIAAIFAVIMFNVF